MTNKSLNKTAISATFHCLTGCGIGEVLGMVISSALGWSALPSVALAVALAFFFGYLLSMRPLLNGGMHLQKALKIALVADTASITVMEIVDNGVLLVIPGAIHSDLTSALFWVSMAFALCVAFLFTFPLNRYLIARGRGHAITHQHHH